MDSHTRAVPTVASPHNAAHGEWIPNALGISVFGGTTQFVVAWLIGTTGNPLAPAWYVAGTGVVGLVATLLLQEARRDESTD